MLASEQLGYMACLVSPTSDWREPIGVCIMGRLLVAGQWALWGLVSLETSNLIRAEKFRVDTYKLGKDFALEVFRGLCIGFEPIEGPAVAKDVILVRSKKLLGTQWYTLRVELPGGHIRPAYLPLESGNRVYDPMRLDEKDTQEEGFEFERVGPMGIQRDTKVGCHNKVIPCDLIPGDKEILSK